jgi:hypothetical protein
MLAISRHWQSGENGGFCNVNANIPESQLLKRDGHPAGGKCGVNKGGFKEHARAKVKLEAEVKISLG